MVETKNIKRKMVVIGDVCLDSILAPILQKNHANGKPTGWNRREKNNLEKYTLPGGALLIKEMMSAAPDKSSNIEIVSYPEIDPDKLSNREIIYALAEGMPASNESYYINKALGYSGPGPKEGLPAFAWNFTCEPLEEEDIIVIDDAGNGFRDVENAWTSVIENTKKNRGPIVIYNMSGPLFEGKLWERISQTDILNRMILIIDVDSLREEGINISRKLSWDRTIADFITVQAYVKHTELEKCPHILVRFSLEGLLYYYMDNGEGKEKVRKAQMFYNPRQCEGEITENIAEKGTMNGLSSAFAGFLGLQIFGKENAAADLSRSISDAIPPVLDQVIRLFQTGYQIINHRLIYPFEKILSVNSPGSIKKIDLKDFNVGYLETSRKQWSILSHRIPGDYDLHDIAKRYVLYGKADELENVPVVSFGKLLTVDKNEIENFRSIKNLIKEYLDDAANNKPLSIAIFGPPGSGKSFAVKSVAKSVMEKKTEILEYNLSQFDSPLDIIRAFHESRDSSLKGNTPLVFFDEFDSAYKNEPLGWLKYFLAPMQDGEFKEGEKNHPIGRAILVFAGGTNRSLKEFNKENLQSFSAAKGPDFVSRLKGFVNILGPNPIDTENLRDTAPRFDRFNIIRRAVLLRVMLLQHENIVEKDKDKNIRIDEDVLRALLLVPKYKHGARSMNAVLNMSMLNGRNRFEKAALPSPEQLSLHVDQDIFMNILERDLIINTASIDRTIHEIYRDTQRKMAGPKPETHPSMADWENLSRALRQNNRMLAENIPLKLLLINCSYRPKTVRPGKENKLIEFTEDEIEYLARMAHERWLEKSISEGWTYGEVRDDKRKIHNCIMEWENLPEILQRVDRNTIKSIPQMFDIAGFEVYRLDEIS